MCGARRLRKRSTAVSAPRAEARTRASVECAFARAVALRTISTCRVIDFSQLGHVTRRDFGRCSIRMWLELLPPPFSSLLIDKSNGFALA